MESKNDSNKCDLKDHLNSPSSQADHRPQSCISHYKSHSVYFYIWQLFFFFSLHRIVFFPSSVLYEFFCINSKILWPIPPLSCHISCHFFCYMKFLWWIMSSFFKKNLLNIFSRVFFFFFPVGINVPELLKHIQRGFLVAYSSYSRSITSSGLIFWLISQLKYTCGGFILIFGKTNTIM